MVGVALELDHQARLGPVRVDLKALDENVDLRDGQPGLPDQVEKNALELGLGLRCCRWVVPEEIT